MSDAGEREAIGELGKLLCYLVHKDCGIVCPCSGFAEGRCTAHPDAFLEDGSEDGRLARAILTSDWLAKREAAAEARGKLLVQWLRENAEQLGEGGYYRWCASDEGHKSDCRASGEHTARLIADAIESGSWLLPAPPEGGA